MTDWFNRETTTCLIGFCKNPVNELGDICDACTRVREVIYDMVQENRERERLQGVTGADCEARREGSDARCRSREHHGSDPKDEWPVFQDEGEGRR